MCSVVLKHTQLSDGEDLDAGELRVMASTDPRTTNIGAGDKLADPTRGLPAVWGDKGPRNKSRSEGRSWSKSSSNSAWKDMRRAPSAPT